MSAKPVLIALDAGTSMLKAVALDLNGTPLAIEERRNRYVEGPGGLAEQDMAETWRAAADTLGRLVARLEGVEVAGLAITGQGDGTWLVDAAGEPAGPALLWLDGRAGPIVARIRETGAGRIAFRETGTGPAACNQSGQLLWLAAHRPEQLARAATAMHCKDWLYFKLTGARATDPSEACFTFGSWRRRAYSDAAITAFGLEARRHLLPPIVDGTTTHHGLTGDAARALGLKSGTPVALGYVDVLCSALGAGIYGTGEEGGTSIIGSTGMNIRLADDDFERPEDAPLSGYRMVFPVPGKTALMQSSLAATLNIDWLVGLADQAVTLAGHNSDHRAMLAALDATVLGATPGRALYHPYISSAGERGPFTDQRARATFAGLDRSLDLPGMMRTVYEGIALAAADCYAAMGGAPDVVSVTGGASRSAAMRAILAAMLDRPVRIVTEHGSGALGAAMIAAVGLGIKPDMEAAARDWVVKLLAERVAPDPGLVATYAPLLPMFQAARETMTDFWHHFGDYQDARTAHV